MTSNKCIITACVHYKQLVWQTRTLSNCSNCHQLHMIVGTSHISSTHILTIIYLRSCQLYIVLWWCQDLTSKSSTDEWTHEFNDKLHSKHPVWWLAVSQQWLTANESLIRSSVPQQSQLFCHCVNCPFRQFIKSLCSLPAVVICPTLWDTQQHCVSTASTVHCTYLFRIHFDAMWLSGGIHTG